MVSRPSSDGAGAASLGDGAGGALVDAGTAVDALGSIDDSDVVAGDGTLGAHIDASSTADTLGLFDCYHLDNL